MPANLSRWLYVPSAVRTEIQRLPNQITAFFAGPFGAWQKNLPKSLELGDSQLKTESRLKLGPSSSLVNTRLELLGQKAARQTKGRPGPLLAELNRAMIGADVGFKGYVRVRGVGYRFQLEAADKKLEATDPKNAVPHLHVSAGLSHPLIVPLNPEFQTAMTHVYKGKGIRYRKDSVMKKEGKKKKV